MDMEWRQVITLVKEGRAVRVSKDNLDMIRELASRNPLIAVSANGEQVVGYETIVDSYKFFCAPIHHRTSSEWIVEFSNGDVALYSNEQFVTVFGVNADDQTKAKAKGE